MFNLKSRKISGVAMILMIVLALYLPNALHINGADHAESTSVAGDPGADIADVFAFLDPNNNSRLVLR